MGAWMDALMEVETMKGRALVKILKGLLTVALVALAIGLLFLPMVVLMAAQHFPHASAFYLWENFADPRARAEDIVPLQVCYLAALVVLGFLIAGAVALARTIWDWLS